MVYGSIGLQIYRVYRVYSVYRSKWQQVYRSGLRDFSSTRLQLYRSAVALSMWQ